MSKADEIEVQRKIKKGSIAVDKDGDGPVVVRELKPLKPSGKARVLRAYPGAKFVDYKPQVAPVETKVLKVEEERRDDPPA